MITHFNNYILESRKSIDELEMLNPEELRGLLHDAVSKKSTNVIFIQDLLTVGCPIDARDDNDWTALHIAVEGLNFDILEFLLLNRANINAANVIGITPLHLAVRTGNREMIEFLISNGANVNARDDHGDSVLHWAVYNRYLDNKVLEFLISKGADIHARDNKGDTPWAVAYDATKEKVPLLNPTV